jgi:hypothetical protein
MYHPIYKLISHFMDSMHLCEEEVLDTVRPLFDTVDSNNGKSNLEVVPKQISELNKINNLKWQGASR